MVPSKSRIKTRISPDLLDTIGRSFKFRHGKGIAEWFKNSLDSYHRLGAHGKEPLSGGWPVVMHIVNGATGRPGPNLAVVDFGGTSFSAINDFFLYWGDTTAASHGGSAPSSALTGGHGNGGKFYMREMWREGARFLTWRDGKLTSLVVDKKVTGSTGYWEQQDIKIDNWREAMELAFPHDEGLLGGSWLVDHLTTAEPDIARQLDNQVRGFTAVVGRRASQVLSSNDVVRGRKWDHQKLIDEIRNATQARRPIRELRISVFLDGRLSIPRLQPEQIEPDPAWEPQVLQVPGECIGKDQVSIGCLTIGKALYQLTGRHRHRNALWVLDKHTNPVAHYPLSELPLTSVALIRSFLHADLQLSFEGFENLVENDRERLVPSPDTEAVLGWAAEQIDEFAKAIHAKQAAVERSSELRLAAILNEHLNEHAQRFLERLQSELLVDYIDDSEGGGPGESGSGTGRTDGPGERSGSNGSGGGQGSGGTRAVEGTSERLRRPRFPEVLLSGYDPDPAQEGGLTKSLTEHHPPLYQDDTDRQFNVWWINTEHTFARQALTRGGADGAHFKSYQLFMFRDVVQRESLRVLQRREAEIALDRAETELDEYSNRFLGDLPIDLLEALLR